MKSGRVAKWSSGRVTIAIVALGCALLCACASQRPKDPKGPAVVDRAGQTPPAYGALVARYNERVARLEALSATVELAFDVVDDKGQERHEQAEGNLKYVRPNNVALRIDKVSQVIFWLGSNAERYWWFDLSKDDARTAIVGLHAKAEPDSVAAFGLPVHPLDLLEVFGVLALPADAKAETRWSSDGRSVVFELPGRWGMRRFYVDEASARPMRIELTAKDTGGNEVTVMSATLDAYRAIEVRGDARVKAEMATRVDAELPRLRTRVRVVLSNVENPTAERIKPANFDYEELKRRQGVQRERTVEELANPQPKADVAGAAGIVENGAPR